MVIVTLGNSTQWTRGKRVKMADDSWKDLRENWVPRVKGSGRDGTSNEGYTEPEF